MNDFFKNILGIPSNKVQDESILENPLLQGTQSNNPSINNINNGTYNAPSVPTDTSSSSSVSTASAAPASAAPALTAPALTEPAVETPNISPSQYFLNIIQTPINIVDTNTYIIALNKSSNVVYLAICTLIIGIVYILVIYLCSFIFIPIDTLTSESSMFSSFLFNPESPITIFNSFVKTKMDESFSNISENSTMQNTIADFKYKINTAIHTSQSFIQYWFNRLLLFFYINKNTINTTKQLNRTSFTDLSIRI